MKTTRRVFVAAAGAGAGCAGLVGRVRSAGVGLAVCAPQVERLDHPLGLEEARPRFSWRLKATGRNVRQAAYRIRVARTAQLLESGQADLWDSGAVSSDACFEIPYDGPGLASRQRCYWTVEVVDNHGRTAVSETSWWEMGLLAAKDWRAAWVNVEDAAGKAFRGANGGKSAERYPTQPAMLLRRVFAVTKPVASARLYATALGVYAASLNGKAADRRKLAPELTDYRQRLLYQVYDVTELVRAGDNVIGAMVGDGWYGGPYSYQPASGMFGPPPRRFLAQLELRYLDGSTEVIATDAQWRIATSPVVFSQIYAGETYDARQERPGWNTAGFDDSDWAPAELGEAPAAVLTAQVSPPIREVMTLTPKAVAEPKPGVYVFDFGQNFAGYARLSVKGRAGDAVAMKFAEILKPSGEVEQSNLRTAKATDVYILRGDPNGETYTPQFTYHGFRYVEVAGLPGKPAPGALVGVVLQSDLPLTGRFQVGHPVVQQLWRNAFWSQRSNFTGLPTDCPQRDERMGWMGDAQVFWDAASFNMDTDAFTHRFMDCVRDGQSAKGAFADVAPYPNGPQGAPGWADGGVILPWTVFRRYGDTRIIDRNWDAMRRWIDYVLSANPDLIWREGRGADYGDWLAVDAKWPGEATTPKDLIGTAFFAHSTALMAEMAKAARRPSEADYYDQLAARITAAFRTQFVRPDGGVGNDSQTSYILALAFDLLPQELRGAAADRLAANIRQRGGKISTGFLGTPHVLDALASGGHAGLAVELLTQTGYPSWGYMVMKGATTMWERWNGDTGDISMNSYNHYAYGAVVGFMYRRLAGIDAGAPGFEDIVIRPLCDPRLNQVSAEYESVRGRIATAWRREGGRLHLDVTIPANARAAIHIPASPNQRVREGGRALSDVQDLRISARTDEAVTVAVGSGAYRFTVG